MSDFGKHSGSGKMGTASQGPAVIFSFVQAADQRRKNKVYSRWISYYQRQEHQDLLDALVYEHENDFPLRASSNELDQLRHKALLEVLQERAHSDFLKNLLTDLKVDPKN